jgi:hypothetical protein
MLFSLTDSPLYFVRFSSDPAATDTCKQLFVCGIAHRKVAHDRTLASDLDIVSMQQLVWALASHPEVVVGPQRQFRWELRPSFGLLKLWLAAGQDRFSEINNSWVDEESSA